MTRMLDSEVSRLEKTTDPSEEEWINLLTEMRRARRAETRLRKRESVMKKKIAATVKESVELAVAFSDFKKRLEILRSPDFRSKMCRSFDDDVEPRFTLNIVDYIYGQLQKPES